MHNRGVLEFIKHYWYLGILFVILIVVLIIGTQQEKSWSTNLATIETKSAIIKDKSASIESEDGSAESEDSADASRTDSALFFLSDHQKESETLDSEATELEEAGSEAIEVEETEALAEIKSEKIDEDDDPINNYDRKQTDRTNSYTPTYSNDNYIKPKSSNSATENNSTTTTTTTSKQPIKTPVVESEQLKESIPVVEPKPIEIPAVEAPVSTESKQAVESAAPEVIESEKPLEENLPIDPPPIEE